MSAFSTTGPWLQKPDRRSFLWSLAGLGVTTKTRNSEKPGKSLYRLLTPECEVRMTVQYFAKPLTNSFRFRDDRRTAAFVFLQMERKTRLAWTDSWVQWPSPTMIFAHGFTPRRLSICGSAS